MFKKFNTKTLLIILGSLGILLAINKFYESRNGESTFHDEFIKIDSSEVKQISINPKVEKGKEIKITKTPKGWDLQSGNLKTVADTAAVGRLLAAFVEIKSLSLAGQDKSSWNDLQVGDTTGSKLKIVTNDGKSYDLVIGKFGYKPTNRSGLTYIRHADEETVYAVEGYLSFIVNAGVSAWRNKTFIQGNKDNWTSLTFTYPGDSSFVLAKQNNAWTVNGQPADSGKAAQYLNTLSNLPCGGFVDQYSPGSTPVYTLSIQGNNQPAPLTVMAYPADSVQKFILHSSLNPDAWFSESQSHVVDRVFVSRNSFIQK
jgi:hypothetical protein